MVLNNNPFPAFPSPAYGSEGLKPNRYISPFSESPFPMSTRDVQDIYFSSADRTETSTADVISENNVSFGFVQEMIAFIDRNADGVLDDEDVVRFRYNIKIFISRDDSHLKEAFEKTVPEENDVCFFLEDNSTDIFSGRRAYAKAGSMFVNSLASREIIAEIETKEAFFQRYTSYKENGTSYALDFSEEEIKELITTGQIVNMRMKSFITLWQLLNIQTYVLTPVYSGIAWILLTITETAREYIEFSDASWDPAAGGRSKDNPNFSPVLLGPLKSLVDLAEDVRDKVIDLIKKGIEKKQSEFKSNLTTIINSGMGRSVCPDKLKSFIEACFQFIERSTDYIFQGIDKISEFFHYIGNKWLNAINAFYCGLWNSIVEIVLGFVDMVGYLFKAMGLVGEAVQNAQTLIPDALEMVDELIQTVMSTNIWDTLSAALAKIIDRISQFNIWALTNSISIEKVAYFLGNVGGFIVEQILDAFISGGTKGVADLLKKFGTVGKDVMDKIFAVMAKALGKTASGVGFSLDVVVAVVRFFTDLLKKGKDDVLKWIDDLFDTLEDAARLADEFIEKIKELFGFTAQQIKDLRDTGLDFVTFKDAKGVTDCKLCRLNPFN